MGVPVRTGFLRREKRHNLASESAFPVLTLYYLQPFFLRQSERKLGRFCSSPTINVLLFKIALHVSVFLLTIVSRCTRLAERFQSCARMRVLEKIFGTLGFVAMRTFAIGANLILILSRKRFSFFY